MPWVLQEARALPALALPVAWPVSLKATGLLPLALVGAGEDAQAGRLLYRLYGMYLAMLSASRAAKEGAGLGRDVASTFGQARGRGPDSRQGYGLEQLADGLLRPATTRDPWQPQGPLAEWPWERGFAEALVSWGSALQWVPGLGQVTYAELALESHSNRAPPAKSGHRHARQVLSPRKRARVLQEAANLLQPLLAGVTLLEGNFQCVCASLVPLGGFRSMGRTERPVFACRPAMREHMQQLQ